MTCEISSSSFLSYIAANKDRFLRNFFIDTPKLIVLRKIINLVGLLKITQVWDLQDKEDYDICRLAMGHGNFVFFSHIGDIVGADIPIGITPVIVSDDLASVKSEIIEEILHQVLIFDQDFFDGEISVIHIIEFVDTLFPGIPIPENEQCRLMAFPMNQTRIWFD
jgi:hypothetical protein